ncbi:MAG: flagellar M-ring protein FliF [Ignavibacteria bacterium]|nr:MAG: flagellar M-ring protein FliF [Ignavibacteria bacterium]KAF0160117.1 MAG: flagellar M-ring protein FliF [Ignavibacteria bacterium]
MNANPLQAFTGILGKLNPKQKVMLGVGVIATVVLFAVLMFILNEPTYSTLYSGLAQEDAGKVVEHLNNQKILYKIEDNGQTIKVQREKVAELRLTLAGKGLINSGAIGYEVFDKSTMGMSEFMQNFNLKRALEGEIARTIQLQEGVLTAKVSIVMPKRTVFREEEKQPTAAVTLKLKSNSTPTKENIQAIVNLLCGSVEGLQPSKVSIIDTKGRILNSDTEDGPVAFASAKQYEIKKSVENHLIHKAQSILDNVLGFGNAVVQVTADLNFDQVEKTMTQFDPESQVVISEGIARTENSGRQQADTSSAANENTVTNYEINKTVQNVVEGTGNIKRLSVAAVINDIQKEVKDGDKTQIVTETRSPEQIRKLEDLIKNAVGIDPARNDQFTIVNIPFEHKVDETVTEAGVSALPDANEYINLVFILVAIVSSLFVLKSLMKRLKNEKIVIGTVNTGNYAYAAESAGALASGTRESKGSSSNMIAAQKKKKMLLPMGDIEDEISEDALAKKNQQERIVNYVTKNPMDAAKLINAWMHEDEA